MIIFKGRDPITKWVLVEHNGTLLDIPTRWKQRPCRQRKGIKPGSLAVLLLMLFGYLPPRPQGSTQAFADRYLPKRIMPGYTIDDEREAELREAACAHMVLFVLENGPAR
jgi:hypothetical protein